MTQKDRLRNYLLKGNKVTPLTAWRYLGIYRLAARIHDLKNDGFPVESEIVSVKNSFGEQFSVAQYSLAEIQKELPL